MIIKTSWVISFNWSGELNAPTRAEAAEVLKEYFIHDPECINAKQKAAFAHSFGGDLCRQFIKLLKPYTAWDWQVLPGTPLGESTGLDSVDKSPRLLKHDDSDSSNCKLTIQCCSNGDFTQAAGSRQMTGIFGNFERRAPFSTTENERTVNLYFEVIERDKSTRRPQVNVCSHVNIKWHAARALPYIIPMILNLYPHVNDLNLAIDDNNNENHLPIITIRNNILSPGNEKTYDRSAQASAAGEKLFNKLYGRDIGTCTISSGAALVQEIFHSMLSQKTQGRTEEKEKAEAAV